MFATYKTVIISWIFFTSYIVQAKVKMNESVVFEDFILLFGIESQMNVTLDCGVSKLRWIQGKHSALQDDKFCSKFD